MEMETVQTHHAVVDYHHIYGSNQTPLKETNFNLVLSVVNIDLNYFIKLYGLDITTGLLYG